MSRKRMTSIVSSVAVCAAIFAFGINAQAGEKPVITSSTNIKALSTLTNQENQAVSLAAAQVLYHTEQAQLAVADKKKRKALRHINQGIKLIRIIRGAAPKYKITTNIKSAGVSYKNSEDVTQRYVTVFNNSYTEDVVTPVIQAKRNKVFHHHHKSSARPEEDFSMSHRMTVTLDTLLAGRMLNIARADVKANKMKNADKALAAIQTDGVILRSVTVPLPLADAADNLYLARSEMSKKHYRNAYVTLKEASKDLKAYGKISGNIHSKETSRLISKIDSLTSRIDAHKNKRDVESIMENSKGDITSWWSEVKGWFNRNH